jgi:hypothetical protein
MAEHIFSTGRFLNRDGVKAAAILLVLLVFCFWPFVIGNKTMLESARQAASIMPNGSWAGESVPNAFARTKDPGAPAWEVEPLLELTRKEYVEEKVLPVWNPYQAFGTPLAANMQSQAYYPLTIALSLSHGPRTRNWYILLRLFLAGICAFLYMRLFVSFAPALASGITSMFGGYYVLYISMPHLSVEILFPAALLAAEHLIRNPRFRNVAWFSLVVFGALTGGMPESSFLLLALTYVYLFSRLITDESLHSNWLNRVKWLAIATGSGFCFSAVLLLPFRQYMRYSFDTHQFANTGSVTGLIHDPLGLSIFTYFLPLLEGSGWDNNLRNYVGLISLFLFLIAILSLSWKRENNNRVLTFLSCFFGALAIAIVSKRYGVPLINSIGALPIFNLVLYPKYEEPALSLSVSILCGIGLERLAKYKIQPIKQIIALGLTFSVIPLALILSKDAVLTQLLAGKTAMEIVTWSIFLPTILLFALSLLLIVVNSKQISEKLGERAVQFSIFAGVLAILTGETLFSYLIPAYYRWNSLPTVASNPYTGAPFVDKLNGLVGRYRIFAEDGVFVPDWPSAFGLFDIRSLDAMYYKKYLPFIQQFFPSRSHRPGDELYDRFTGAGIYQFDDFLQERLLQLSSIKYIVTMPVTRLDDSIVGEILRQNSGRLAPHRESQISKQTLAVGGVTRIALGEHPPYDRLPYRVTIDKGKESLHFSYGINPAAFAVCGDGVGFVIEARDTKGAIKKLFTSYVDPRHDAKLRRWIDGAVDLSSYRGQDIEVLLSTNGGPKGDVCADWAVWSDFHFDAPLTTGPFRLVYNNEVNIYEYRHPLPRAVVYYDAEVKESENEVLKDLAAPSLDVFRTVLLNGSALHARQKDWIKQVNMTEPPNSQAEEATITSYKSQEVTVDASPKRRGILVLNDSDYPGWTVDVDGRPGEMVSANYLFRGVALEPGNHVVRFAYKPHSVRVGAAISGASLFSFFLFGVFRMRKRPQPSTESVPSSAT